MNKNILLSLDKINQLESGVKKVLLSILILSSFAGFPQENPAEKSSTTLQTICRSWYWTSNDGAEDFEMEITEINGDLKGTHCSVACNGKYIDCSYEDTSIELHRVEANIFEGTIQSGYSDTTGKIRLTFDKSKNTVHFQLMEEPTGIFYLPQDVVMNK